MQSSTGRAAASGWCIVWTPLSICGFPRTFGIPISGLIPHVGAFTSRVFALTAEFGLSLVFSLRGEPLLSSPSTLSLS